MWRRIRNIIRAFLGLFIRMAEDPKLMLEQYIDDVRAKIPALRATAASVYSASLSACGSVRNPSVRSRSPRRVFGES